MSDEELERYRITPDTEFIEVDLDQQDVRLPDGRRLTEQLAEQIGEEVAARRHAGLIPGRKSLSKDGSHSPVLQVRLPTELHARLTQAATERHVSVSALARTALEQYLPE